MPSIPLTQLNYMGVEPKIGGKTPKSSILMRFSITNHPFWGTTMFGNPQPPHHFLCVFVTLQFGAPTIFIIALTCKRLPLISIDVLRHGSPFFASNDQLVENSRAVEDNEYITLNHDCWRKGKLVGSSWWLNQPL